MPKKPKENHESKVGDRVTVTLHTGRLVDATVKAVYGRDETALVHLWQVYLAGS